MIRYRIDRDIRGQHIVLPALPGLVPIDETYATRAKSQDMAGWLNRCQQDDVVARVPILDRGNTNERAPREL